MTSLLGENILQLANRLQQKQQMLYGGDPDSPMITVFDVKTESTTPPSLDSSSVTSETPALSSALGQSTAMEAVPSEDHASGTSTSSGSSPPPPPVSDLAALLQQSAHHLGDGSALSQLQSLLPSIGTNSAASSMAPWVRNAGRKKSHPVWEFFRDLKGENGSGVMCMHCPWNGDDRSPNNLRTHLKKSHSHDGIFQKFSERLAMTPTQPYVKRVRAGGSLHPSNNNTPTTSSNNPLLMDGTNLNDVMSGALSFLDSIPRIDEVINITARFNTSAPEDEEMGDRPVETSSSEPRSSSSPRAGGSTEPPADSSPTVIQGPPLFPSGLPPGFVLPPSSGHSTPHPPPSFPAMLMATNPFVYMNAMNALNAASQSPSALGRVATPTGPPPPPPFLLSDGASVSMLMKMALDLDLTLSYHKRRGEAEITFESNRTAEKSGGRGKQISLADVGREIRITERVNGSVSDSETWIKTDLQQFHWAIRGKCAKALAK